jgi:hypothetical protein
MTSYYDGLTDYINEHSGLYSLSAAQVKAIVKADKEMRARARESHGNRPHGRADLMRDLVTGDTRCTARSKQTGERCKRASSLGANVCRAHGSAAPQTRAKAQRRLAQAADVLVQRLLSFALDGNVADPVAMQAINSALDRAGLRAGVDLDVTLKPFQQVFEQIELGGSRAKYRGEAIEDEPQRELPAADDDSIDIEIVDADEDNWPVPEPQPEPYDDAQGFSGPNPFEPQSPPAPDGLMSFEAAVSAAAAAKRQAVKTHRAQRALPRGR